MSTLIYVYDSQGRSTFPYSAWSYAPRYDCRGSKTIHHCSGWISFNSDDGIWAFNKKVIDPIAPRYTALDITEPIVRVIIEPSSLNSEEMVVDLHPKVKSISCCFTLVLTYLIPTSVQKPFGEQRDACEMKSGDIVTFVNWGNLRISSVKKSAKNTLITLLLYHIHFGFGKVAIEYRHIIFIGLIKKPMKGEHNNAHPYLLLHNY
uniref:Phytocyanin domain-containing protein n=1 Tax=Heterorhabditis bacteriophora TaxID=37862 RepID=A0A1I7W9Y7_HETBA